MRLQMLNGQVTTASQFEKMVQQVSLAVMVSCKATILPIILMLLYQLVAASAFKSWGKVTAYGRQALFVSLSESEQILSGTEISRPTPKVPASAWRWPPVWPFPEDFLSNATLVPSLPAEGTTSLLVKHVGQFLEINNNILEIGVDATPIVSSTFASKKITFEEIDSVPPRSVDSIVISSGIESVLDPKTYFKKVWKVLKPEGSCQVCFFKSPVQDGTGLKMWTTMTEEQKVWIAGSYYFYSINNGWKNIEGFDVQDVNTTNQLTFSKQLDTAYVVRAEKQGLPVLENPDEVTAWLKAELNTNPDFQVNDLTYLSLRLASRLSIINIPSDEMLPLVDNTITKLSQIYSVLNKVQESTVPSAIKATLAFLLIDQVRSLSSVRIDISNVLLVEG